ncbi:hypothetical protein [Paludisphaera sp.]|uniref:hypothetical protein n=1 Tax=Paludisphaera sp. TaxID=2017432 RepID=UPI00301E306D
MKTDDKHPSQPGAAPRAEAPAGARLFIHEPGWRITIKRGSEREFCHMMAPGKDYYHRLLDGEIVLQHDTERLCMACAARRGVISHEMRRLPDEPPKLLVESDAETILVLRLDEPK